MTKQEQQKAISETTQKELIFELCKISYQQLVELQEIKKLIQNGKNDKK